MKTENLTTDELFNSLPNFINLKGDIYHFGSIKGSNRIIIFYKRDNGKYLCDTHRTGETLQTALKSMLDWLIDFKFYELKSENLFEDMTKPIVESITRLSVHT